MLARRSTGFDIVQEAFENGIEVSGCFPERGMLQPGQAMTAAFPQIGISDRVKVIEIHQAIRTTVDHCERKRTAFHDQTLIHAFSGTCGLEEPFSKTAVCARDSFPKETALM